MFSNFRSLYCTVSWKAFYEGSMVLSFQCMVCLYLITGQDCKKKNLAANVRVQLNSVLYMYNGSITYRTAVECVYFLIQVCITITCSFFNTVDHISCVKVQVLHAACEILRDNEAILLVRNSSNVELLKRNTNIILLTTVQLVTLSTRFFCAGGFLGAGKKIIILSILPHKL